MAVRGSLADGLLLPACLYALAIAAVVAFAFPISGRLRFGTGMLLLANELLVLTFLFPGNFALESIELMLYYVAVVTLVTDPSVLREKEA